MKGKYGYIQHMRRKKAALSALLLLAVIIIYAGGFHHYGSNQNVFSIIAALCALPTAVSIVQLIMFLRAKPCSVEAHRQICEVFPENSGLWDLYLTSEKRNYQISHAAWSLSSRKLIGFTEDPACDVKAARHHLEQMFDKNGIRLNGIHISTSLNEYLRLLAQMDPAKDRNGQPGESDAGQPVRSLLCAISL